MKKTTANWGQPSLTVDCPYCEKFQGDVLDDIPDNFENLGKWMESEKDLNVELECQYCKKTFIIAG